MEYIDKNIYWSDLAIQTAYNSDCIRRWYGAAIVKDDELLSIACNHSPKGRNGCNSFNICERENLKIPRGQRYECCRSVHAEQRCIIQLSKEQLKDSTLYLVCINPNTMELVPDVFCCSLCERMIIEAGIKKVVFRRSETEYEIQDVSSWMRD